MLNSHILFMRHLLTFYTYIYDFSSRTLVGSHSGRFVSIDIASGGVRWLRQLPDRIEATATLSASNGIIAIGICIVRCLIIASFVLQVVTMDMCTY